MNPETVDFVVLSILAILLGLAAWQDIKQHRIPNKIVFVGVVLGFLFNGLLPQGLGFNSPAPGGLGWLAALAGLGMGLALLLPIYWLRAMGAGDVKLMAMVGAFLGSADVLGAVLATFIAGGVMALTVVLWSKQLGQMLQNIKLILLGGLVKMSAGQLPLMNDLPVSVGKLPYAVAITVGTLGYLIWQRFG